MSTAFPFMELPRELRNVVYYYVLGGRLLNISARCPDGYKYDVSNITWSHCTCPNIPLETPDCNSTNHSKLDIGFLHICKAMSDEAAYILYSTNLFAMGRADFPLFQRVFRRRTILMKSLMLTDTKYYDKISDFPTMAYPPSGLVPQLTNLVIRTKYARWSLWGDELVLPAETFFKDLGIVLEGFKRSGLENVLLSLDFLTQEDVAQRTKELIADIKGTEVKGVDDSAVLGSDLTPSKFESALLKLGFINTPFPRLQLTRDQSNEATTQT